MLSRRGFALLVAAVMAGAANAQIVNQVRSAMIAGDWESADRMLAEYRQHSGTTPEELLALSWIARGLLDAKRLDEADKRATVTRTEVMHLLVHRKLDAEAALPEALGAAIEVHAQVLARKSQISEAVTFLKAEAMRWRGSSIQARIQKNLHLLTLEGKMAPPLDVAQWTGDLRPQPLSALRGLPVLLFFWAHWCADCKAEASVVQDLQARYGPAGLRVVGPTMRYGFVAGGEEVPAASENAWIEQTRKKYYSRIGSMPVPISDTNLRLYGVSTTPTLVLVDRHGVVRLYHPGAMSFAELAPLIKKLLI